VILASNDQVLSPEEAFVLEQCRWGGPLADPTKLQSDIARFAADAMLKAKGGNRDQALDDFLKGQPPAVAQSFKNNLLRVDIFGGFGSAKSLALPAEPQVPILNPVALFALAGEFVRAVEPHTEADNAALIFTFMAGYGNAIGSAFHTKADGRRHEANLFVAAVGATSSGRKGTSLARTRELLDLVEPDWAENCITSGSG
jgi:hypothetical protein